MHKDQYEVTGKREVNFVMCIFNCIFKMYFFIVFICIL